MKQQTSEWFQARSGCATGSKCADILAFLKSGKGETKARADYRAQIVCEILTGEPQMEGYLSPFMEWGTETEPKARTAYELKSGVMVEETGFVLHGSIARMGGSPDGLVGDDGMIEIKCPKTATHIGWMLGGVVPEEHEPQMAFYMAVTGRAWCDFVSYDPRLPEPLRLFVVRLERNPERIAEIEAAVIQFNAEVDAQIARLREIAGPFTIPAQMQAKQQSTEGYVTDDEIRDIDPSWKPTDAEAMEFTEKTGLFK